MCDQEVHRSLGRIEGQLEAALLELAEIKENQKTDGGRIGKLEKNVHGTWFAGGIIIAGLAAAAHIKKLF